MTQLVPHTLGALDALNPLAFLAALGCLAATTDHARRHNLEMPRLSFLKGGAPSAVLHLDTEGSDALLDRLVEDLDAVAGRDGSERDPFLAFSYPDDKSKPVRDLKPPPTLARSWFEDLVQHAGPEDRRTVDWAAATMTDVAVDGSGQTKPFALHFTAGQQRFLVVANELVDGVPKKSGAGGVEREHLREAVFGPWKDACPLKVFSWSPLQERAYALRALDPSSDQKLGTPGADWLALRGVSLLSSAPEKDRIATSGVYGRWKGEPFSYPIWETPMDVDAVRSLLRHPAVGPLDSPKTASARRTLPRDVEILTCSISRSDQGGYGAFSRPSRR